MQQERQTAKLSPETVENVITYAGVYSAVALAAKDRKT
jgi:hypothetical protein